jgi:hypothetical protein
MFVFIVFPHFRHGNIGHGSAGLGGFALVVDPVRVLEGLDSEGLTLLGIR